MLWRAAFVASLIFASAPSANANFAIFQVNGAVAAFQGDPNITATPGTIAGSITASRSSCNTPCFIQVSPSITATGSSRPYEQGEYSWNFGDASGSETVTDPFTGNTVNLNSQVQPEAAYVYRSAGTYTVTLTVRFCTSGNCVTTPTFTQATFTQNINVTAFSPTSTFFYSAAGSGTTCSSGSPCAITQFSTNLASNTQHNFNRGDNVTNTVGLNMSGSASISGIRLDAFGSGAKPKININSGSNRPIDIEAGHTNQTVSDIVISNLELDVSGSATSPNVALVTTSNGGGVTGNVLQDIYFDHSDFIDTLDISGFNVVEEITNGNCTTSCADTLQRTGVWFGTVSNPLSATTTHVGILGGPYNWHFVYGVTVSGGADGSDLNHHIYNHIQTHLVNSYNTFGNSDPTGTAPGRNYNMKWSFDPANDGPNPGGVQFGQFASFTHNSMGGTKRPFALTNNPNDPTISRLKNVVYSKNVQQGFTGENDIGFNGDTVTLRDEIICNNGTNTLNQMFQMPPNTNTTSFLKASVYRERIFTTSNQPVFGFQPATTTWTVPEEFTDNQVQCTGSGCVVMNTTFSQQVSSGSLWDRNSWFCPNTASGACFSNNGTAQTLAQWQTAGLGPNDNQNNPNFPNGATCNLGARQ